jgi:hypothetical protein
MVRRKLNFYQCLQLLVLLFMPCPRSLFFCQCGAVLLGGEGEAVPAVRGG